MAEAIQLHYKGNRVTISCPKTKQTINITLEQAKTLYRALRIIHKKKEAQAA